MDNRKYPVKLVPILKDYIWGGQRLKNEYGKASEMPIIAESWELAVHKDGENTVANGAFKGMPLSSAITEWDKTNDFSCLGSNHAKNTDFPLLIKLIDAHDRLSVQVHPDDAYASAHESDPSGKTEMWYIADAEPNTELICGFKKEITREELISAVENETLPELLQSVPVKKGDVFFIPSKTVHAIGKGILIAEIQQNSNNTYRLYDYGRLQNGQPRPLHVEKASASVLLKPSSGQNTASETKDCGGYTKRCLSDCEFFTVWECVIRDTMVIAGSSKTFSALTVLDGIGEIKSADMSVPFAKGESFFIPANLAVSVKGNATVLLTQLPS